MKEPGAINAGRKGFLQISGEVSGIFTVFGLVNM
jgi:hypothetical protein